MINVQAPLFTDSFLQNREGLMSLSEANRRSLADIESAAFIICLDDAAPESSTERAF